MQLNSFIEGLEIIRKYYSCKDGHHLGADHDVIYFYATDEEMSEVDYLRLWELGFFQEGYDENYDPAESWWAYV
ncbi:MAG: hypothetical protein P4L79_09895 [Legionella sp.]|uniref:hypothetical protein n=1 Tax=Legionella sp. TaxID=459 RepID=UPI0028408315|nr:hypothetical protein [Legionella sp.]